MILTLFGHLKSWYPSAEVVNYVCIDRVYASSLHEFVVRYALLLTHRDGERFKSVVKCALSDLLVDIGAAMLLRFGNRLDKGVLLRK